MIVKRTGEPTYLLPDIAYHRDKFARGFDRVIDVQGADHIEQFPFVRAAAAALGCEVRDLFDFGDERASRRLDAIVALLRSASPRDLEIAERLLRALLLK